MAGFLSSLEGIGAGLGQGAEAIQRQQQAAALTALQRFALLQGQQRLRQQQQQQQADALAYGAAQQFPRLPPSPPSGFTGPGFTGAGPQIGGGFNPSIGTGLATMFSIEGDRRGAVGASGELGPGQVMPSTGRQYGFSPDQLMNSREPGTAIYGDLYNRSGGDTRAALVGYNRGPGAMQKYQAAGDDLSAVPNLAPAYKSAIETFGAPAAAAAQPIAKSVAAGVPSGAYGRSQLPDLAQLIEKAAPPDTPGEVKFLALAQLNALMAPEAKQDLAVQLAQMRGEYGEAIGEIRGEAKGVETPYQKESLAERTRHDQAIEGLAGGRAQEAVTKGQEKATEESKEIGGLADEAAALAAIVKQHPDYVGARGVLGTGMIASGLEQTGIKSMDPGKVAFKARLDQFQASAMKALTNVRYFSGTAAGRMRELLPGLRLADAPTSVIEHLENASKTLREQSESIGQTSGAVGKDVGEGLKSLSDDALRQEFGQ